MVERRIQNSKMGKMTMSNRTLVLQGPNILKLLDTNCLPFVDITGPDGLRDHRKRVYHDFDHMSLELAPHLASLVALFPICSAGRLTHRFQKENTDKWERSDGKRRTCGKENIEQDYLCSFDAFYLLYVITCLEIYLCCQVNSLVLFFGRSKF